MIEADILNIIGTPQLSSDVNLELPIVINTPIPGLSLPGDAAVIVSWADIQTGTEPEIFLRGLDSLKGFEGLTGFGLNRDLNIERALDEALDVVESLPEIRFNLADGTQFDVNLSIIDPLATGVAIRSVSTFGNLADAIRLQTDGKVTLDFSPDGGAIVLNDNSTGGRNLPVDIPQWFGYPRPTWAGLAIRQLTA